MLKRSNVVFIEDPHAYWLVDKELSGVSHLYNKHILKREKYVNDLMRNAADYGTRVHKEIEQFINHGVEGTLPEFRAFKKWLAEKWEGLEVEMYGEFLIDNGTNATAIDILFVNHKKKIAFTVNAKCTTNKYPTEWAWQSSFERSIFEQQTGYDVAEMYALQLQGEEYQEVELQAIDPEKINTILECEKQGTIYNAGELALAGEELDLLNDVAMYFELEKRVKQFKQAILQKMQDNKIKRASIGSFNFTVTEPTSRQSLDSKALEKAHPEIYAKFIKTTQVAESLRIKILNKEG